MLIAALVLGVVGCSKVEENGDSKASANVAAPAEKLSDKTAQTTNEVAGYVPVVQYYALPG